ncbi:toll/interleukin-1 receptor domain-containing protein [Zoogloea sp.]|uniref:toll/interleukin-1 receptor domain-containing protein n=1 Tax=Zoogloea sp. TaxID=49181 RepID=UPI001AC8F498|nr:toll/interleukin-1 receptor domain-containing protein [Zoogloea sp.]MBN8283562.1 toll/interleukin-1 receptor domain-containing protein [Zoogloea sp.]
MAKLFFSYSHKDEDLRNELETHLALLKRQGVISSWHDRRISAGSDIDKTIDAELESSQIILLLVSAHFLASDYCFEREMARALEKHNEGSATVIPVILHPCDWHSAQFGKLRATPTDGKAISMYANRHEALAIVARDVREIATSVSAMEPPSREAPPLERLDLRSSPKPRSSNLRVKRKFDDHERDGFLEDSYEYIARYFDGSLEELAARNPQLKTRFKRLDATSFTASIYKNGQRVAQCSVWYGSALGSSGIAYSQSADAPRNSLNESLSVVDDGYALQLKPLGMQRYGGDRDKALSEQGAAEYYWEILIRPLQ